MRAFAADIVFEDPSDRSLYAVLPDVVVSESHKASATATEQPVELGAAITDHVIPQQDRLSLEVVFSDTPLSSRLTDDEARQIFAFEVEVEERTVDLELPAGPATRALASANPPRGVAIERRDRPGMSVTLSQPTQGEVTRTRDSWGLLLSARDGAWLATITTALRTYESMVLVSAETTRTAKDGTWIVCQLEFVQITQVATELVDAPVTAPRNRRGVNQGPQPTEEASEPQQSLAFQALGAFGLFGGGR